ncbi:hypothetical protein [Klebsiella phage Kpn17]|uniref:Uncharacterized protein n=1 Tax=Klebsiella phage Kpn17 TaxID=3044025 RepID=A0AAT9V683_9CAUD|nr:hypothetical protein [Klebsiella phage Kpn17]
MRTKCVTLFWVKRLEKPPCDWPQRQSLSDKLEVITICSGLYDYHTQHIERT